MQHARLRVVLVFIVHPTKVALPNEDPLYFISNLERPAMRNLGFSLAVSLVVFLGFVVDSNAAPLDLRHVSVDAAWLGHVDFDAMRESIVVQKAMAEHKHAGHKEFIEKTLRIDPDKDLHGMTFYGKEIGKRKGVMILHAKVDRDHVMSVARMFSKAAVADYRDHKLHCWTHKSRHSSKTRNVAAVFYGEEAIVLASSVDELKQAVDVLEGKSPSLAADSALAGNIPAGTTMLMRVEGVSDANLPDKCKVAKQTKSFRFVTGEYDGESFYRARAKMTQGEVVGQLTDIVEGLRALGQIHVGDNETGRKLLDALRINTDGTTLTVLWSAPAEDVWAIIDAHRKIYQEKKKQYRQRHGRGWLQDWGRQRDGCEKAESGKKDRPPEEDF
jgi:hypothetical protein